MTLVSALGFGFGWINEDLCRLGGSFADDPNIPVVAAQFALPAHLQASSKAVTPRIVIDASAEDSVHVGSFNAAPEEHPAGVSSLQNPRRC